MDGIIYTMKNLEKKVDEMKDEDIHEYAEALIPVRGGKDTGNTR